MLQSTSSRAAKTTLLKLEAASCSCTCRRVAASRAEARQGYSSAATEATEVEDDANEVQDIRSKILQAAIPKIPEYGFTLKAIQEGIFTLDQSSSTSSLSSYSPLFIEQLFPSLETRPLSAYSPRNIARRARYTPFKSAETPFPFFGEQGVSLKSNNGEPRERIGPRRALFEAWAENGRKQLLDMYGDAKPGTRPSVQTLLETRLTYNQDVQHHLREGLAALAKLDPSKPSLPLFKPYFSHVFSLGTTMQTLASTPQISPTRLATVYSLSELYQLSKSNPHMEEIMDYAEDLLQRTKKYDGLISETAQFGKYALLSWRNIIKARGM